MPDRYDIPPTLAELADPPAFWGQALRPTLQRSSDPWWLVCPSMPLAIGVPVLLHLGDRQSVWGRLVVVEADPLVVWDRLRSRSTHVSDLGPGVVVVPDLREPVGYRHAVQYLAALAAGGAWAPVNVVPELVVAARLPLDRQVPLADCLRLARALAVAVGEAP
jgi:hypothetical protein